MMVGDPYTTVCPNCRRSWVVDTESVTQKCLCGWGWSRSLGWVNLRPVRDIKEQSQLNPLVENIRCTFAKALTIVAKKNGDYGAVSDTFANFRGAVYLGLSEEKGILMRMMDKIIRINHLLDHPAYVTEESMDDTILDLINYAAILKAFRDLEKNKQ